MSECKLCCAFLNVKNFDTHGYYICNIEGSAMQQCVQWQLAFELTAGSHSIHPSVQLCGITVAKTDRSSTLIECGSHPSP